MTAARMDPPNFSNGYADTGPNIDGNSLMAAVEGSPLPEIKE